MPNWCSNTLRVIGPAARVAETLAALRTDDHDDPDQQLLDFGRVIPRTDDGEFWGGSWGTKWNACSVDLVTTELPNGLTQASFAFNTAWSPPRPVAEQLSAQHPDLIVVLCFDEPSNGFSGAVVYRPTPDGTDAIEIQGAGEVITVLLPETMVPGLVEAEMAAIEQETQAAPWACPTLVIIDHDPDILPEAAPSGWTWARTERYTRVALSRRQYMAEVVKGAGASAMDGWLQMEDWGCLWAADEVAEALETQDRTTWSETETRHVVGFLVARWVALDPDTDRDTIEEFTAAALDSTERDAAFRLLFTLPSRETSELGPEALHGALLALLGL